MEVAAGCRYTARLADKLGKKQEAAYYRAKESDILHAVSQQLWSEEKGAYYPYVIPEKRREEVLMASTFLGLAIPGSDTTRIKKLCRLLVDDQAFNWHTLPLTSVAKYDPLFTTVQGDYIGNPCWSGSVWTLTNRAAIRSLHVAEQHELAAQLACKTLVAFENNWSEFVHPFTGSGEGVRQYAWSASQYIQILLEDLIGVQYSAENGFSVQPHIPVAYAQETIRVEDLPLPNGARAEIEIKNQIPSWKLY